jgi:hypothetical protein
MRKPSGKHSPWDRRRLAGLFAVHPSPARGRGAGGEGSVPVRVRPCPSVGSVTIFDAPLITLFEAPPIAIFEAPLIKVFDAPLITLSDAPLITLLDGRPRAGGGIAPFRARSLASGSQGFEPLAGVRALP